MGTGRKHQLSADRQLARAHAAGARIAQVQPAEHDALGTLMYEVFLPHLVHMQLASKARDALEGFQKEIAQLEVDAATDNIRFVRGRLAADTYGTGATMIVNAVMAVQYLCADIEATRNYVFRGKGVLDRLSRAVTEAEISVDKGSSEYAGWKEIVERRRSVEHPEPTSLSSPTTDPTAWDAVPAAWMLSEKSLRSFDRFSSLFQDLELGRQALRKRTSQPRTFEVERGVRSDRPSKRPPRN